MKILYLEDDVTYAHKLVEYLTEQNFDIRHAKDLVSFDEIYENFNPQLILSDLYVNDIDINLLLKTISSDYSIPKLIISNTVNRQDEVTALNYAIEDFIHKDSNFEAIKSRILRVLEQNKQPVYTLTVHGHNCILNTLTREITNNQEILIKPTNREFEILSYFLSHKNIVISTKTLLDQLNTTDKDEKYVTVIINRIRTKFKITNIVSIRSQGYMWQE